MPVKGKPAKNEKMYLEEIRCISEAFSAGSASLFLRCLRKSSSKRTNAARTNVRAANFQPISRPQFFSQPLFRKARKASRRNPPIRPGQNRLLCQRQRRQKRIAGEKLSRADIFSTLPRDRSPPRGKHFFRNVRKPPFRRKWDDAGPARG